MKQAVRRLAAHLMQMNKKDHQLKKMATLQLEKLQVRLMARKEAKEAKAPPKARKQSA